MIDSCSAIQREELDVQPESMHVLLSLLYDDDSYASIGSKDYRTPFFPSIKGLLYHAITLLRVHQSCDKSSAEFGETIRFT